MNFLLVFVLIPVLMTLVFLAKDRKQVLGIMVAGSTALVAASVYLIVARFSPKSRSCRNDAFTSTDVV